MKKILYSLLSENQIARVAEFLERKFVLSVNPVTEFAIFRNGIEISGTRFGRTPADPMSTPFAQISGNARISVNPGDVLELRHVGVGAVVGAGDVLGVVASINITKEA